MKICLLSPYIPKHFGGGEKYLLDVATVLSQKHQVSVAVPFHHQSKLDPIKKQYEEFLGRSLAPVQFIYSPLVDSHQDFLSKVWWTRKFDALYYATDGSLFFSLAKKNILHIQIPLKLDKSSTWEKLKLANWQVKNTNSQFTKKIIEEYWQTKVDYVHYPMVDTHFPSAPKLKKEKVILHVGRFFQQLHAKRQDVLIDLFKELLHQQPQLTRGWKLVLVGKVEDEAYAHKIAQLAAHLPIEIHHQVSSQQLHEWYERASIYWHATGFGVDENLHPEKMEHFGISTVEAMAAGCIPVVIDKGGQPEILGSDLAFLLWKDQAEAVDQTLKVMKQSSSSLAQLQLQVQQRATHFNRERFEKVLWKMIGT